MRLGLLVALSLGRLAGTAAAPVSLTVSAGDTVDLPNCCNSSAGASLAFRPRGSGATARCNSSSLECIFTADVGGEYEANGQRVVAIDWGNFHREGEPAVLVADHFDTGTLESSDTVASAWRGVGAARQASGRGLELRAAGDGLRSVAALNFLAQPLIASLDGLVVAGRAQLGFAYVSADPAAAGAQEGLFVEIGRGGSELALRIRGGGSCTHGTRCTLASDEAPACGAAGLSLTLVADAQNATLTASCAGAPPGNGTRLQLHAHMRMRKLHAPHRLNLGSAPPSAYSGVPSGACALVLGAINARPASTSTGTTGATSTSTSTSTGTSSAGGRAGGAPPSAPAVSVAAVYVRAANDVSVLPRVLGDTADLIPVGGPDLGPAHAESVRKGLLDTGLQTFGGRMGSRLAESERGVLFC